MLGEVTAHRTETSQALSAQQKEVLPPQIVSQSVGEWQGRSWHN
ncbi:hypothetical protein ACKFKG_20225 [Phormidesmis sp. 146-35]